MRLVRALRASGSKDEALAAYTRLSAMTGATCAGVPAQLVGRHALAEISGREPDAAELTAGLLAGRWHLTKGQFEFYWAEAARIGRRVSPPPPDGLALAAAASMIWEKPMWRGATGRGATARWAVLLVRPPSLLTPAISAERGGSSGGRRGTPGGRKPRRLREGGGPNVV